MLLALLQQQPSAVGHYAGGASADTAGHTALAGSLFRFLFSTVPQWVQIAGILVGVPVTIIVVWQLWKRRRQVWAWWLARRTIVKFALAAGVFLVFAGATTGGLAGYTYVMHNNDFCQSCHIMDAAWNRFQASAHKKLQCHACHRQPMYASTVELYYWVVHRTMKIPAHDRVPDAVCDECHRQKGTDSTLMQVMFTAGHAVHLRSDSAALKDVQCVTCHGRDFHVFVPNNSTCTQSGCHTKTRVELGAMSKQNFAHCTVCHDFKSRVPLSVTIAQARTKLTPAVTNCFSCHVMKEKTQTFDLALDPHKGNCGICHDPHKQQKPNDAIKTCAESQCHGAPDTLTAFHRGLRGHQLSNCLDCHQAHSWRVKGKDCTSCHDPRTIDARRKRAASLGTPPGEPRTVMGLGPPPPLPDDSLFRHTVHKKIACTTCHGTASSHGALAFSVPSGCVACHHGPRQRAECTQCHARDSLPSRALPTAFAISARSTVVTRPVTFAHARHNAIACTTCHGQDLKRSVTRTCERCHAEHHTAAADCAACHPSALAVARVGHDRTVHDGCARCHTDRVVAALPPSRSVCLACHEAQRNHYPAGDCATCHALANIDMMRAGRTGSD